MESSESYLLTPGPRRAEPHALPGPSSWEPWPWTPGRPDLPVTGRASTEPTVAGYHVPAAGDTVAPGGDPWDKGSLGSPPHPPGKCCPGGLGVESRPCGSRLAPALAVGASLPASSLTQEGGRLDLCSRHVTFLPVLPDGPGSPCHQFSGQTESMSGPKS